MARTNSTQSQVLYEKMQSDFMPSQGIFGARFRMLLFFVIGTVVAILHHLFYSYLNNKPITTGSGNVLREQAVANAIGNALAYLVNSLFSAAIAEAFVQQFWAHLRTLKGGVPIRKIDAIVDCKDGIATPSALKAWYYAFWLFVIATLATSMAVISVVVPGSLKVASENFHASQSCAVNTVNLPNGSALDTFVMQWFQRRVISQGTFMPPSSSCDGACRYNISFEAPALNCTNITSSYDFTSFTRPPLPISVSPGLGFSPPKFIYNGTQMRNGTGIQVATLNTSDFTTSAVECISYRASYDVTITHSNVSTSKIDVLSTNLIAPVPNVDASASNNASGILQIANGAINLLNGTLYTNIYQGSLGSSAAEFTQPSPVMGSPLLILQGNLWRWTMDMQTALPSIMQNISLSLLSDDVASASKVAIVKSVTSTCFSDSTFYVYNRTRLLITYGVAVAATAACIIASVWAIHLNGGFEESLSFTRLLGALVNLKMAHAREQSELTPNTHLHSNGGQDETLIPLL
ncbi:hypothetical protein SCHPADRAFT_319801 [Schizopora paradoxa]|uniref:Transmembrane protein n=1 Tax=Schizopora paradoxa TaxID=27342 RepID=A0A0H2SBR8_9AGAM|nr:hypothetical protein SCHPADRAFT_319801 [Schizopora paradoxa]